MADDPKTAPSREWWEGTVCPTGSFRLKLDAWDRPVLQKLVRPTGGGRGRWVRIETVHNGASDDE